MDARNELYEPRIQHAHILLEKEGLEQQIQTLLQNERAETSQVPSSIDAEREKIVDRTQAIITRADELKANLDKAKEELAKRKEANARRRSELSSAKNGVEARRLRQIEDVEKSIKMTKYKWNQGHNTLAASRTFLCGEAAKLYGLRKSRRSSGQDEYKIGSVSIMDLRTLNSKLPPPSNRFILRFMVAASPAIISTALSHVVHLLMLSTHYLSIRLPAEITLPHRDYPLPTIFSLAASYQHSNNVPFPGTTPTPSSSNSPTASRHSNLDQTSQPRPRPLFLNKPLPILASEDPVGYSLFIESVTLLAYDVAWVCKSQGVSVGDDSSFDDICNIGKNMYNLLIGPRTRPLPTARNSSSNSNPTKAGRESDAESGKGATVQTNIMGRWSHGSAHTSLSSAAGYEFVRSWKLLSPAKFADRLKSKLMSEVANAEWEVLDEDAWAAERYDTDLGEEAVVVGARKITERGFGLGMQSFVSMRTVNDAAEDLRSGSDRDKKQGNSGWTKLKPR